MITLGCLMFLVAILAEYLYPTPALHETWDQKHDAIAVCGVFGVFLAAVGALILLWGMVS